VNFLSGRSEPGSRTNLFRQRMELLRGTKFACEQQLALPDHVHQLDPRERHGGRPEGFEPQHRSYQSIDGPMILLNNVVEIFGLTDLDANFVLGVETFDRRPVGAALVDRDLLRRSIMPDALLRNRRALCDLVWRSAGSPLCRRPYRQPGISTSKHPSPSRKSRPYANWILPDACMREIAYPIAGHI
jgi:hypothetical protein